MTECDVVVVGAGSAGCVVARRLADVGHRVLLLEAGGSDRRPWLQLPIGYGRSFYDPRVNWMYRTAPDSGLAGRQGYWPRGKVLGGSSTINAMVFVRGHPRDFDDWQAMGNPGWGWDDVLPWFKRMEDFSGGADEWRGAGGPLHVADVSRDCHPLCRAYLAAASEIGLPATPDFNGARMEGVGLFQITVRDGRRMSASRAYLWPVQGRANLRIETDAMATRVLFERHRAVGIEYRRGGNTHVARAGRMVVLSAGSIGSAHLLQLSGIGPAGDLQALGIDVVRDNPAVGRHLQDHLCIDHLYRARVPTLNQQLGTWRGRAGVALDYALRRRGPLAISVNQGGGFVRTRPELDRPNVELYFSPLSYTKAMPGKRALMKPDPFPGFLLSAQPCRPTSRGAIRIVSPDPLAPPAIEPNSLSTDHDVQEMLEATKLLRRLAAAPSLAAAIEAEIEPGDAVRSDEVLADDIRRRASTVFHPVGTCRMGPEEKDSVVDQELKVHGIDGLRIVDASIFPTVTSGNTNAPAIMVGEKGAAAILAAISR